MWKNICPCVENMYKIKPGFLELSGMKSGLKWKCSKLEVFFSGNRYILQTQWVWLVGWIFICSQNVTILRNKTIYRIYRVSTCLINMYYKAASISTIHVYSCRCSKNHKHLYIIFMHIFSLYTQILWFAYIGQYFTQ